MMHFDIFIFQTTGGNGVYQYLVDRDDLATTSGEGEKGKVRFIFFCPLGARGGGEGQSLGGMSPKKWMDFFNALPILSSNSINII